ncbi:MAG: EF2563 family selenium-dependent molybdenum hydroxylase system protein [Deltaproteobacteria bacterium]|nr:MAG: EF2563 family selenium-dependent molybdenum hydroxylase system protein [Deltaproteobacteria bacterium]
MREEARNGKAHRHRTPLDPRSVRVLVRGAGDLATGVGWRLARSGFPVIMTEIDRPTVLRRSVAFAEAIYEGETIVEGIRARRVPVAAIEAVLSAGEIPILVDPELATLSHLSPSILIDGRMRKGRLDTRPTRREDAHFVVGLGPGFQAGKNVHAVVETQRGHHLGRVLYRGSASPDTGKPGVIAGESERRVLRAGQDGIFRTDRRIGTAVQAGEVIGHVDGMPVRAQISGIVRGLLHTGLPVRRRMKLGDIDPRGESAYCFTISDKSLAVAGGVLEALLHFLFGKGPVLPPTPPRPSPSE